jgi:hypothetical protein
LVNDEQKGHEVYYLSKGEYLKVKAAIKSSEAKEIENILLSKNQELRAVPK